MIKKVHVGSSLVGCLWVGNYSASKQLVSGGRACAEGQKWTKGLLIIWKGNPDWVKALLQNKTQQ